jgi:hypothetical protein
MKGFLTAHDRIFRKTHDLDELASVCEDVDPTLKEVLIPSCSLPTINDPIEACGGGDQFSVVFQGD